MHGKLLFHSDLYVPIGLSSIHFQNEALLLLSCRCFFSLEGTRLKFCHPFLFSSSFGLFSLTFQQYFLSHFICPMSFQWYAPSPSIQSSSSSTSSCTYIFILAQQQVLECLFECGVAQCVTSWVDGRVDITQPVANRPYSVWDAGLAEG